MNFVKATKQQSKLRLAIIGPAGSGKTYSALGIAVALAGKGGKVAVIDTERGSASLYADMFAFDVLTLDSFSPLAYVEAIAEAEKGGYAVIVIDSLSHAWASKDGALEMVDREASRSNSKNSYTAWRNVTPVQNKMVDAIIGSKAHIICTMRSKMEYVMDKDEKGKTTIRKIGLQPIQREGLDYEFTICGDMDQEHKYIISKSRCPAFADAVIEKPGKQFADKLLAWLDEGAKESKKTQILPLTVVEPVADKKMAELSASAKLLSDFQALIKEMEPAAIEWLVKHEWIKAGEGVPAVTDENLKKAMERPAAFKTAVKTLQLVKQQEKNGSKVKQG